MAIRLIDRLGRLAEIVEMAELMRDTVKGLGHRLADALLAIGDHAGDRHRQGPAHLVDQARQVRGRGRQEALGRRRSRSTHRRPNSADRRRAETQHWCAGDSDVRTSATSRAIGSAVAIPTKCATRAPRFQTGSSRSSSVTVVSSFSRLRYQWSGGDDVAAGFLASRRT